MPAESSDSMMPSLPADRRPAIWPWLVMPLITLALFYGLDRLKQAQEQEAFGAAPQATHAPAEPAEPGTTP